MIELYKELNDDAMGYLMLVVGTKSERINKELELLYDKGLLFIIEILYRFKIYNKNVKYRFNGTINNLELLYELGLIEDKPVNNTFNEDTIDVELVDMIHIELLLFIEDNYKIVRLFRGSSENIDDNYYVIVPIYVIPDDMTFRINDFAQLETVEDYHKYLNEYIIIKLGEVFLDEL